VADDDLEQRLAAAAEAFREQELTARRGADLRHQLDQLAAQLASLRAQLVAERRDVERLEGLSLARVVATLEGARDEDLARERAEAEAVQYRIGETEGCLDAVRRKYESVLARLGELTEAPATYTAVLNEKERRLTDSGDPRSARLLELAEERGLLAGELREIDQAVQVARAALQALSHLQARLGDPSTWSSYYGPFNRHRGLFHTASTHSRLNELARMAAYADHCVAVVRVELADVRGVDVVPPVAMPPLVTGLATGFADVWLEHRVSVPDRIRHAHNNVARCMWLVDHAHNRLVERATGARARIGQLAAERRMLLTGG
jgi:hypothetical protein